MSKLGDVLREKEERIAALTAERDNWRESFTNMTVVTQDLIAERDEFQQWLEKYRRGNEKLDERIIELEQRLAEVPVEAVRYCWRWAQMHAEKAKDEERYKFMCQEIDKVVAWIEPSTTPTTSGTSETSIESNAQEMKDGAK